MKIKKVLSVKSPRIEKFVLVENITDDKFTLPNRFDRIPLVHGWLDVQVIDIRTKGKTTTLSMELNLAASQRAQLIEELTKLGWRSFKRK